MNFKYILRVVAFAVLLSLGSCGTTKLASEEKLALAHINMLKEKYAPDRRVAMFDVQAQRENGFLVLKGETDQPEAYENLREYLKSLDIRNIDSIQLLPSEELDGKTAGVIKISVANLRSRPSHSSELVTQAMLGTPVKVLKKDGSWYYIQTPEGYLAWTDYGGVTPITPEDLETWRAAEKLIFIDTYGFSRAEPNINSPEVSDLTAGNILELLGEEKGFYKVRYPNGKTGFVEASKAVPYSDWLASLQASEENLVATSKELMGIPYLWGGTSAKGVDCSGYTKTVFFLNGIILPRDASQQIRAGIEVDSTKDFENLQPGDLLFFGRKATENSTEKVIHVGMWIGDNKFIHSMGDVHISTFDKNNPDFDEYNYNRYLRTKRILGQEDENMIQLKDSQLFYSGA